MSRNETNLCAPSLIVEEVANTLWRAIKHGRISEKDAREAINALNDMRIELHETNWAQACLELNIACSLDLTIYDASYLLLAKVTAECYMSFGVLDPFSSLPLSRYLAVKPHLGQYASIFGHIKKQ